MYIRSFVACLAFLLLGVGSLFADDEQLQVAEIPASARTSDVTDKYKQLTFGRSDYNFWSHFSLSPTSSIGLSLSPTLVSTLTSVTLIASPPLRFISSLRALLRARIILRRNCMTKRPINFGMHTSNGVGTGLSAVILNW